MRSISMIQILRVNRVWVNRHSLNWEGVFYKWICNDFFYLWNDYRTSNNDVVKVTDGLQKTDRNGHIEICKNLWNARVKQLKALVEVLCTVRYKKRVVIEMNLLDKYATNMPHFLNPVKHKRHYQDSKKHELRNWGRGMFCKQFSATIKSDCKHSFRNTIIQSLHSLHSFVIENWCFFSL